MSRIDFGGDNCEWNGDILQSHPGKWYPQTHKIFSLSVVPSRDFELKTGNIDIGRWTLGVVVSSSKSVDDYIKAHQNKNIQLPATYSNFDNLNNVDKYSVEESGYYCVEYDEKVSMLRVSLIEGALRILNDHGRFRQDEYKLYDCLPNPAILEREDFGAIAIAPAILEMNDEEI